nr:unnamed protein product [Digitaria exilis]
MEEKIQRMVVEIIDMAVDKTLDFCLDKVLAEEEVDHDMAVTAEEGERSQEERVGRACKRMAAPSVAMRRTTESAPPHLRSVQQQLVFDSYEMHAAAAGIKEVALSPTRSSPRLARVVDQHVMDRAKKRAAWGNLDITIHPFVLFQIMSFLQKFVVWV